MDLMIIATIVAPIIAIAIDRKFLRKPKLVAHWGHNSAHRVNDPNDPDGREPQLIINTHSLFVGNDGSAPASNVRVTHTSLERISVELLPNIEHRLEPLRGGGRQLVIPKLVEKNFVQIQYVGLGVKTDNITGSVYCDEGNARWIPVRPMRVFSRPVLVTMALLMFAGALAILGGIGYSVWRTWL